jgi:hypothetical protein
MEFYPSVDDPEKYTRIIEPWFLNALNKMSDSDMCYRMDRTGWHANDYPMS